MIVGMVMLSASVIVLACGDAAEPSMAPLSLNEGTDASGQGEMVTNPDAAVEMTVRLLDPASGRGISGVRVSTNSQMSETDSTGRAAVMVAPGPYAIRLERSGTRTHVLYGNAGSNPFEQITFYSSESITGFVLSALSIDDDPNRGMVVVGLDTPSLAPAVGAMASLSVEHDPSFILTNRPMLGDTVIEGAGGFVTFPNVETGEVSIAVDYPSGDCKPFPSESGAPDIIVEAGVVSIFAFTCRD